MLWCGKTRAESSLGALCFPSLILMTALRRCGSGNVNLKELGTWKAAGARGGGGPGGLWSLARSRYAGIGKPRLNMKDSEVRVGA